MKLRTLGRTGLRVSELGFGTWGIGGTTWIGADDQSSVAALVAARDAGVNFFDTALVYGRGHSEQLLARTFGKSPEVLIASKAPPKNRVWPAQPGSGLRETYPANYLLDCLHATLRNLGRDAIDLYQFHVWSDEWASDTEWRWAVEEIRRSGKARYIGISINDHQAENAVKGLESGLIDTVQVIYNVFDQSPDDHLLPYCFEHKVGVIARVPFDEGGLTGAVRPDSSFPEGDFRNRYFAGQRKADVWQRVQHIVADLGVNLSQLPEIALRFCLSHPGITTVIPGMRSIDHVRRNVEAVDRGQLGPEVLQKLYTHRWIRSFYDDAGRNVARRAKGMRYIPERLRALFS